jgi:hypothetical protein
MRRASGVAECTQLSLGVHVQMKVGHSQAQIAARFIHVAHALVPGAAAKAEARMVALTPDVPTRARTRGRRDRKVRRETSRNGSAPVSRPL